VLIGLGAMTVGLLAMSRRREHLTPRRIAVLMAGLAPALVIGALLGRALTTGNDSLGLILIAVLVALFLVPELIFVVVLVRRRRSDLPTGRGGADRPGRK
jgi:hypothetical protein